jgi:mannose-6-phosphate isomerase-like protein (cupin superfamily)
MPIQKVNLAEKFSAFSEHWNPKIVGTINDSLVKLVKFKGEFLWHHHENEDELFLVVSGRLRMKLRDPGDGEREIVLDPGEFLIVPRGVEHCPRADAESNGGECQVVLVEPDTTVNTGNVRSERTRLELQRI